MLKVMYGYSLKRLISALVVMLLVMWWLFAFFGSFAPLFQIYWLLGILASSTQDFIGTLSCILPIASFCYLYSTFYKDSLNHAQHIFVRTSRSQFYSHQLAPQLIASVLLYLSIELGVVLVIDIFHGFSVFEQFSLGYIAFSYLIRAAGMLSVVAIANAFSLLLDNDNAPLAFICIAIVLMLIAPTCNSIIAIYVFPGFGLTHSLEFIKLMMQEGIYSLTLRYLLPSIISLVANLAWFIGCSLVICSKVSKYDIC